MHKDRNIKCVRVTPETYAKSFEENNLYATNELKPAGLVAFCLARAISGNEAARAK